MRVVTGLGGLVLEGPGWAEEKPAGEGAEGEGEGVWLIWVDGPCWKRVGVGVSCEDFVYKHVVTPRLE